MTAAVIQCPLGERDALPGERPALVGQSRSSPRLRRSLPGWRVAGHSRELAGPAPKDSLFVREHSLPDRSWPLDTRQSPLLGQIESLPQDIGNVLEYESLMRSYLRNLLYRE